MIQDHKHFEAALDAAERHLDDPPAASSARHDELMALLREIAAYRPLIVDRPEAAEDDKLRRLGQRLDAFETRVLPQYGPHWQSMVGGDFSH